jgi:hypothetical protein
MDYIRYQLSTCWSHILVVMAGTHVNIEAPAPAGPMLLQQPGSGRTQFKMATITYHVEWSTDPLCRYYYHSRTMYNGDRSQHGDHYSTWSAPCSNLPIYVCREVSTVVLKKNSCRTQRQVCKICLFVWPAPLGKQVFARELKRFPTVG